MSIDWITVVAQIANFLLLVWLLKKFLYRPILDGIAAREADIAQRMAAADHAQAQALAAERKFQQLSAQVVAEQETLLEQALAATAQQRDALLSKTHAQLLAERKEGQRYLEQEKQEFLKRLEQRGAESLLAVSQKIVTELADDTFENAVARQLIYRLEPLLPVLLDSAAGQVLGEVRSHLELSSATQQLLQQQLQQRIPKLQLQFHCGETNAVGVSLHIGGAQVAWTLASYIEELTAQLTDLNLSVPVAGV